MILVLPAFLYPVLAMSVLQLAQFLQEKPTRVGILGDVEAWPGERIPALFDPEAPDHFHPSLFSDPSKQKLLQLVRMEYPEVKIEESGVGFREGADRDAHGLPPKHPRTDVVEAGLSAIGTGSGGGKSYIALLVSRHPSLRGDPRVWISPLLSLLCEIHFPCDGSLDQKAGGYHAEGRLIGQFVGEVSESFEPRETSESALVEADRAPDLTGEQAGLIPATQSYAEQLIAKGLCDVVLWFPPGFFNQLAAYAEAVSRGGTPPGPIPQPEVFYSTASERSQLGFGRLSAVLERWREQIARHTLASRGLSSEVLRPFEVATADVAQAQGRRGVAMWAKILPVILLIWAMTGAFYPAIDACAGEKERGTLETLLTSAAERTEIVLGKLVMVVFFSIVTALCNVVSMVLAGWLLLSRLPQFGPPPLASLVWLPVAVVPVAVLFGAISLAVATWARSTKEGQYYLMPVVMLTLPLVLLPMAPGAELTAGNSLVPITGLVLILRSVLSGEVAKDWPYLLPVSLVTIGCAAVAVRWAVEQFSSERVLFREAERWSLRSAIRRVLSRAEPVPSASMAVFLGVVIVMIRFLLSSWAPEIDSFRTFAWWQVVTQVVTFAVPAIGLAFLMTARPMVSLNLRKSSVRGILAAAAIAVLLFPMSKLLQAVLMQLYPPNPATWRILEDIQSIIDRASLAEILIVLAVVPAICEELAFRGFIFSGLARGGRWFRGAAISAIFFALSHPIVVQQFNAFFLGIVLALLVATSGSLWVAITFHVTHNGLALIASRLEPSWGALAAAKDLFLAGDTAPSVLQVLVAAAGAGAAFGLWWWVVCRKPIQGPPQSKEVSAGAAETVACQLSGQKL